MLGLNKQVTARWMAGPGVSLLEREVTDQQREAGMRPSLGAATESEISV